MATETGATPNQVVLAWLIGGDLPVIPLVGASSVAQLEENLGALDLDLRRASGPAWIRRAEPTRSLRAPFWRSLRAGALPRAGVPMRPVSWVRGGLARY